MAKADTIKKDGRGGAREGSGRDTVIKDKNRFSVDISGDMVTYITGTLKRKISPFLREAAEKEIARQKEERKLKRSNKKKAA